MDEQRNQGPRRRYTLRRRQARSDETRERITAAAFDLHATIGPSRTTISAIAERAGVQRHTVYSHFPDLDTLYEACTAHGMRVSNIPEPSDWEAVSDPKARLRYGLTALFAYYRANERMLATILGDAATSEPPVEPDLFDRHMGRIYETLAGRWTCGPETRTILAAVIGHAMAFETWRSLTGAGLSDDQARDLLVRLAVGVAGGTLGG